MDGNEVIAACKKVLAVQEELLKEMRQEGANISRDMRTVLAEVKRNSDAVAQAKELLAPAVKSHQESQSSNASYYFIGGLLLLFIITGFGGYYLGAKKNTDQFYAAVEYEAQERAKGMIKEVPQQQQQPPKQKK